MSQVAKRDLYAGLSDSTAIRVSCSPAISGTVIRGGGFAGQPKGFGSDPKLKHPVGWVTFATRV